MNFDAGKTKSKDRINGLASGEIKLHVENHSWTPPALS